MKRRISPAVIAVMLIINIITVYLVQQSQSAQPLQPLQPLRPAQSIQNAVSACVIVTNGMGHGSGVHIGDGIILTAGHCINVEEAWIVAANGRTYTIIDQWADPFDEDIGFIRIRDTKLPHLELGSSAKVDDVITVIGTPLDMAISFNVTHGAVSKIYTDLDGWWYDAMVVDAPTYPGNSGGPILNTDNEIVGILVGGYIGYDNLSICEPVENILWSLASYKEYYDAR